ncbi:MAG: TrbG/VirB9 family P-type conjugative transfer protein [Methylocystaceae bacterium]|nr:TrbG/VirB9 family P-type conjugative transfer protein [Methylocystaceae bacterium]
MKTTLKLMTTASMFAIFLAAKPALSQTALPPIPESKVQQTENHHEGKYTKMARRQLQGGEIQEAWDDTDNFEGIFTYERCDDCTFKVRLREHMTTYIRLPKGEKITQIDVGDQDNFQTKVRNMNTIAVKPIGFGGDTNMIVSGEDGRLYPFYLRVESVNSKNIPDQIVRIHGEIPTDIEIPADDQPRHPSKPLDPEMAKAISDIVPEGAVEIDKDDFVKHIPVDVDKLRGWGQYDLWGDEELKPATVFRDNHFTYIKYTKEQWAELELGVGYVVIDEIDENVNTHVQGTTFIVESTSRLISLKSGKKYICLKFEG